MKCGGGTPAKARRDVRLLVVEDEDRTARLLAKGLGEAGHVVDVCADGLDGLAAATSGSYDIIVLDLMLPKLDGWSFLAGFREQNKVTPTLILSARDDVRDRVRGLKLGADDYLVKPFAFDELLARLDALSRRNHPGPAKPLAFVDLTIEQRSLTASRGSEKINLTAKEFMLLELLLRHQGEVLSRTFISERIWDMSFDIDSNVIEVNIRRLRRKVDEPFDRKLIHTVKGCGYVLR
jgi:two-component system, OmpR family, copper resistance phosphate regulon response regulator CusR